MLALSNMLVLFCSELHWQITCANAKASSLSNATLLMFRTPRFTPTRLHSIAHATVGSQSRLSDDSDWQFMDSKRSSPSHILRVASQDNVSTTACHVGSDCNSLTAPTLGHNLRLTLHILRLSVEKLQEGQQQSASNKAAEAGLPLQAKLLCIGKSKVYGKGGLLQCMSAASVQF